MTPPPSPASARPRLRHVLEYAGLRAAAGALNALPLGAALALAWLMARLGCHVLRFRRRETGRRIRAVLGPDAPPSAVRRVAWLSLRNTAFNAVEIMRLGRLDAAWMRRHLEGYDATIATAKQLIDRHGGLVLATPHMGNWDLAGAACHRAGIAIFSVAARQRNPLVNAWINRQRGHGIDILERGSDTLRQVVTRLRGGQAFAILPDVRMRVPDLTVPFLGSTANLGRGMALFARAAGVPVLPVIVTRQGWRRQRLVPLPAVFADPRADKRADAQRVTAAVLRAMDAAIRSDPGQWFWYNRRWVLEPCAPRAATGAADPA